MININDFLRDDLKDFKPYHSPLIPCKAKLDANESPYILPESVKTKIINFIQNEENFNIYPDTDSIKLRTALAKYYGILKENIICGVGSDQIIDIITKTFLNYKDVVSVLSPSFSMYKITSKLNHGEINEIQYNQNFSLNVDKIINSINKTNTKILFLCTPNNPTGQNLDKDDIIKILENVNSIVVLDEAYSEFSNNSFVENFSKYDNLIILKAFSKAYGIAGLRVGYAISNEKIINLLNISKPPYNLSVLSEFIAAEVLKESETYKERVEKIKEYRDKLFKSLEEIDFIKIYPTEANFILIDSKKEIVKYLKDNGVLVRFFTPVDGYKERIRISVGNEENNQLLVNLLKSL